MPGLVLTGLGLIVLLAAGTVGALIAAVLCWDRPRWRRARRVTALLVCQLLALTTVAAVANRQLQLYSSWSDLAGRTPTLSAPAAAHGRLDHWLTTVAAHRPSTSTTASGSAVVAWTAVGAASGLSLPAEVYLPGAYFTAEGKHQRFPVVEFLAGFPGSPNSWLHSLALRHVLDEEIAAGRMAPTIAVLPTQNVSRWHDSECVNPGHGPQLDTYLGPDVHAALTRDFRANPSRSAWASIGYSTGGFCAVNLALRHPNLYAAAASLSGYFTPITDATTGHLYAGSRSRWLANNPQWLARHRPADVALWIAASGGDQASTGAVQRFVRAARPPLHVTTAMLPSGGHNFAVWRTLEPAALDWLAAHLAPPLAPPLK